MMTSAETLSFTQKRSARLLMKCCSMVSGVLITRLQYDWWTPVPAYCSLQHVFHGSQYHDSVNGCE